MEKRLVIHIDEDKCDGCGQCIPGCQEGALAIVDGKARLVSDVYCDGLGACLGECPNGALTLVEREAAAFDEAAVEKRLQALQGPPPTAAPLACGCPSSEIKTLTPCQQANRPARNTDGSALGHWPVKLRLVPPEAPFLQDADLLLVSDCAPVAMGDFQTRLAGKAVLIGCPKFDDTQLYLDRLTAILRRAKPSSLTVMEMEVPCCSALGRIAAKALELSDADIPAKRLVVARNGELGEVALGNGEGKRG
jgi:Pyruvate/2-oxoacid:ferredoxin oxidoreductase delta subunit